MTEDSIFCQYNDALFMKFGSPAMQKLATKEILAEKVFKYLKSFDYNCRKPKTYLEF